MAKSGFIFNDREAISDIVKLHNPRIFADAFGMKKPLAYCANEDCAYYASEKCPAGDMKKDCPNVSKLDYKNGCPFFVGTPYQSAVISNSLMGKKPITLMITGRGTGKSAIMNTQKAIMEATIEPYIRALMFKCDRPVPTKVIVVGNTKDTALLLRNSIHQALESNETLYSFVSEDTKTYIKFINGSEIFIRTAGVDGRTTRGFHADVIKNRYGDDVRCTIVYLFDEACFTRAPSIINEVMRPSLQVGNCFSGIFITSTPWGKSGEIYEMYQNPGDSVMKYNFASYHNKFTNLDILLDFRERLQRAGAAPIYNREVRGQFQSEEGLFFPWPVWAKSIDDSIDWLDYEEIKQLAEDGVTHDGNFYLALDPNRFKQLEEGDFSAYLLLQVSRNREHIRAISHGKYLMDLEDTFLDRVKKIKAVFQRAKIICCGNSGYISVLRGEFGEVIPGSNETAKILRSMSLAKVDMVHGTYKQPESSAFEDERRCYIPKDPSESGQNVPRLDHKGKWGQGYTSDLMDCLSFAYQQIIEDYGLDSIPIADTGSFSGGIITSFSISQYQSLVNQSAKRLGIIRK